MLQRMPIFTRSNLDHAPYVDVVCARMLEIDIFCIRFASMPLPASLRGVGNLQWQSRLPAYSMKHVLHSFFKLGQSQYFAHSRFEQAISPYGNRRPPCRVSLRIYDISFTLMYVITILTTQQVTRLCESPFISQAFREQERSERVQELEQGGRAAQLKIDHLQVGRLHSFRCRHDRRCRDHPGSRCTLDLRYTSHFCTSA